MARCLQRIQLQPDNGGASSSAADGRQQQRGSGSLCTALDYKFSTCMFARILVRIGIRPFSILAFFT
jgi:hypothetical protein